MQDEISGVVAWQVSTSKSEPTKEWTEIENSKEITVTKSGLTVGTYYIWAKDSQGNASKKELTVTKKKIEKPTAKNGLKYNGKEQVGVAGTAEYTVIDGAKIDAGEYTATIKLTDKTNTIWADTNNTTDDTIEWSIAKKEIVVIWGSTTSWVYDGNEHAPSVTTPVDGVNGEKINLKVDGKQKNVGKNYEATASIESVENGQKKAENYQLEEEKISFTISAQASKTTVEIKGTNTYGEKLTADYETNGDGDIHIQWWYSDSENATSGTPIDGANAKDYTVGKGLVGKYIGVTVTVDAGDNYGASSASDITDPSNNTTGPVAAKKITAPTVVTGLIYTGTEQTGVPGGNGYKVTDGAKTDADNYKAKIELSDKDNTVWADTNNNKDKEINWSIAKKKIAVEWNATDSFTYNGNNQGPTLKNTQVNGVNGEKINLAVTGQKKDVGTNYTATANISSVTGGQANKDNYELTGNTKTFAITAKDIGSATSNITGKLDQTTYTYDGTAKEPKETIKDGDKTLTKGTD